MGQQHFICVIFFLVVGLKVVEVVQKQVTCTSSFSCASKCSLGYKCGTDGCPTCECLVAVHTGILMTVFVRSCMHMLLGLSFYNVVKTKHISGSEIFKVAVFTQDGLYRKFEYIWTVIYYSENNIQNNIYK